MLLAGVLLAACASGIKDETFLTQRGFTVIMTLDFQGGEYDGRGSTALYFQTDAYIVEPKEYKIIPKNSGYYLDGWYYSAENGVYSGRVDFSGLRAGENFTIYAKWAPYQIYSVVYFEDGAEETELLRLDVMEGEHFIKADNPVSREGYTFINYYSDPQFNEVWDDGYSHAGGGNAVKIYTKWIEGQYTLVSTADGFNRAVGNIYLMNDIDFTGVAWRVVSFSGKLEGNVDGNGRRPAIKNVTVPVLEYSKGTAYHGLFMSIDNAEIRNIDFVNINITVRASFNYDIYVGLLAGQSTGRCVIENCTLSGNIIFEKLPSGYTVRVSGLVADKGQYSSFTGNDYSSVVIDNRTDVTITEV